MALFDPNNPEGLLTIGGVLLNDEWVTCVNNLDFLPQPDERGDNREVPDVNGAQPYGFLTKETEVTAKLAVRGSIDWVGETQANPWAGVIRNWLHLRAVLLGPYTMVTTDSLKVCSFATADDGPVLVGPCQVRGMKQGGSAQDSDGDVVMLATCRVRLLNGELAEAS